MAWDEVGYLIKPATHTVNSMGDPIPSGETERAVYINKKSVQRSEFYQAAATGLKPEIVFEVHTFEYEDETVFRHGDKRYNIIRVYDLPGDLTELICSGLVSQ